MVKGKGDDYLFCSGPLSFTFPSLQSLPFFLKSLTSLYYYYYSVSVSSSTSYSSAMAPPLPTPTTHFSLASHHQSSCNLFLFKLAVLSALLLLALPLFPSRPHPPSSPVDHFWELLHLLFVGIAFSYGLFSRKTLHFPVSDQSPHHSLSDLSMMFHVSPDGSDLKASPFQLTRPDGFSNPCGYAETNVVQAWNSQYNHTPSMVVVANGYRSLGLPVRSLKSTVSDLHGSGFSSDSNNSPPFSSSASPSCNNSSDQMRNRNLDTDRALPSPISWRSRSGRMEVAETVSNDAARQFESVRARPPHFQAKASSFPPHAIPSSAATKQPLSNSVSSELPCSHVAPPAHSSSIYFELSNSKMEDFIYKKMASREETDSVGVTGHAHSRHPSIDETECESPTPKSDSFRSDASFSSSATSSYSHSPLQSISSELPESNIHELTSERAGVREEPRDFVHSLRVRPLPGDETQSEPFKSRPFHSKPSFSARTRSQASSPDNESSGSRIGVLEKEKSFLRSSPPTMSMDDMSGSRRGSPLEGKERGLESPKRQRKREARGKSVRTIRGSSRTGEARYSRESFRNQTEYKVEKMVDEDEAVERGETRMRARGYDDPPKHTTKQSWGYVYPVPNQNSEKHNAAWKLASEDGSFSEDEQVEEELVAIAKSGLRADPDEVNKKADEFIAKFREQIRLQKTASIDLSGELNINDNYFR